MKKLLIVSEDGAGDAFAVVQALTRQILRHLSPALAGGVRFVPLSEGAQQAVPGNLWKSRSPRDRQKRIELMRALLAQVLMDDGFVVYHIDGDQVWAKRGAGINVEQFRTFVRDLIRTHADERKADRTAAHLESAFARRLILLVPFYSIESWLYQSTQHAMAICDGKYRGKDRDRFATWGEDRGLLDEVSKPKEETVLGGRHNRELAEAGIPVRALCEAGKSFAQAVDRFRACPELLAT